MIQLFPTAFPPSNTAVIDKAGAMTNAGMAFWRALFNRTGQDSGALYTPADNLTAAGTTQADALVITADWNNIVTVPVNSGVLLPALTAGQLVWLFNNDPAQNLKVYPPVGASITYLAANPGVNNPVTLAFANILAAFYFSNTAIVAA
jgi:hypothetical protein